MTTKSFSFLTENFSGDFPLVIIVFKFVFTGLSNDKNQRQLTDSSFLTEKFMIC